MASHHPDPTRRWPALMLACALAGNAAAQAAAAPPDAVRVWVELGEPASVASAPDDRHLRTRAIERQQRDTVQALRDLGGTDIARTRHVGNAIVVRIARGRLDAVRALPGVLRVRPADTLHPPDLNVHRDAPGAKTR